MMLKIAILICVVGTVFGAALDDAQKERDRENPVPLKVSEELKLQPEGGIEYVPEPISGLQFPVPSPPPQMPGPPPMPAPPIVFSLNDTSVSGVKPILVTRPPPMVAFNQPGVYMERYFWPVSQTHLPSTTTTTNIAKGRSPHHLDPTTLPTFTTQRMANYQYPYQYGYPASYPASYSGTYPQYYYNLPQGQDYYVEYFYEYDYDQRRRQSK